MNLREIVTIVVLAALIIMGILLIGALTAPKGHGGSPQSPVQAPTLRSGYQHAPARLESPGAH